MSFCIETNYIDKNVLKSKIENILKDIWESLGHEHPVLIYQNALATALRSNRIFYESKRLVPIIYKEATIGYDTIEMIIEKDIVVVFNLYSSSIDDSIKKLKRNIKIANCSYGIIATLLKDKCHINHVDVNSG